MDEFMVLWREAADLIRSRPYTSEKRRRVHEIQDQLRSILGGMAETGEPKGDLVTHSLSPELKAVGGPSEVGHT